MSHLRSGVQDAGGNPRNAWEFLDRLVSFFSAEWLLTKYRRPNGGGTVLARSFFTTIVVYLVALAIRESLDPANTLRPSWSGLQGALYETIGWFGVIFAGVYASFYTRFSQQWTYLANLYNQIKSTEVRSAGNLAARIPLAQWKFGFIEDAITVHLAAKPLFSSVIEEWQKDEGVAQELGRNPEIVKKLKTILPQTSQRQGRKEGIHGQV